eukprot:s192_g34.t1
MAAPPPATPPDAIPEDLKEDVDKLTKGLSVILVARQIPWHVQAAMGRQGYITVEDLADRWDTPEAARQNGPTDLGFLAGTHGFDQATTAFTTMRLLQAVRTARQTSSLPGAMGGPASPVKSTSAASSPLEANLDRRLLEETYMKHFSQNRPRLEHQGSDALLKRQFKFVNRGELGFIPVKYLVSALPEEGERPTKTTKRFTLDGWEGQEEEEIRANPTTRRQLERMHMVFRTTLLMCLASVPQFGNLALTKRELDDWYDWFYGEDIAGRHPAPSEAILLYAERNAWCRIHDLVHGGESLSQALKTIRQDLLFWTREVYEREGNTPKPVTTPSSPTLEENFPQFTWMQSLPPRLRQRLHWTPTTVAGITSPVMLLLYAGKDDAGSLDSCLHSYYPELTPHVWVIDNRRDPAPRGQDMLADQPYSTLCTLAAQGQILFVGGGPNCRTWSILRWFPKPGAPKPVRGRPDSLAWGLDALSPSDQEDVDNDSVRQMYLTSLAYSAMAQRPQQELCGSFLEHPSDRLK